MKVRRIESVRELREMADPWDDLWARSAVASPMLRARLLANWIDHFEGGAQFVVLAVEDKGRLVAALPLLGRRLMRVLNAGVLPVNDWTSSGDLLLDQQVDMQEVLETLWDGTDGLPWSMLAFDEIEMDSLRWLTFRAVAEARDCKIIQRPKWQVARVAVGDDMDAYLATLPPDHRRNVRSKERKLDAAGEVEFLAYRAEDDRQIERLVREGFVVEDLSWKGAENSSVIRAPGALDYYTRLALEAARLGHLELLFLKLNGRPIAFAFNLFAKGCHFGLKMGYDPQFSSFAPGVQIVSRNLRRLHADREVTAFDFYGPLLRWSEKFATHKYQIGRLLTALPGTGSKLALSTYAPFAGIFAASKAGGDLAATPTG